MAFEMLRRHDFAEAAWLYSRALRLMTAKVGKPQAFNQTTTIAFLSLIAERMERSSAVDFAAFVRAHPDMLDKTTLSRWYRPQQLASEIAGGTSARAWSCRACRDGRARKRQNRPHC